MSHVLLDTHAWAWSLTAKHRLSAAALAAIDAAETVSISAISLYEIGQKVRLGKWPEMANYLADLTSIAGEQGGIVLPLSAEVCVAAAVLDWGHRDPFDRFIGTTALLDGLILVSADTVFDDLSPQVAWQGRVW